jgi:outer membrane protein TolC
MKNAILKIRKIFYILTLIFISNFNEIYAQELNLEMCLNMADTANLSIRNSRIDVAINKKQIAVYNAARLPKLNFSGDYKYNAIIPGQVIPAQMFGGPPGTYSTVKFGVPYNFGNTLQFSQILYNPQLNYGIQALNLNQKIIEIQEKMTELDVKYQVASTYFNLQALDRQLNFLSQNSINLKKIIANTDLFVKQGMILETEKDKLSINLLTIENNLLTIQATKTQLETLLKILIGIEDEKSITLSKDEMIQKSILVDQSTITRPELELIEVQLALNHEERKGTNMAYLPSLSFYAAYNYTYNMNPDDDYRTGINSSFFGLRLDWNLFDGFEKLHSQQKNKLNRSKLETQNQLLTQQIQMETQNNKRQIDIQLKSLEISKKQLELAEKVFKQVEIQYNQGTVNANDFINAENSLQQAQTNIVSTYVQLRQAELNYLKSIGNIK